MALINSDAQLLTASEPDADFYAVIKNISGKPVEITEVDGLFCGMLLLKIDNFELKLREPEFYRAITEVTIKPQKRIVEAHSSIAYPIVMRRLISTKKIPGDPTWTNLLASSTNQTLKIMAVGDWFNGKPQSDWLLLKVNRLRSVN